MRDRRDALGEELRRAHELTKAQRSIAVGLAYIETHYGAEAAAEEAYRFADDYAIRAAKYPTWPGQGA